MKINSLIPVIYTKEIPETIDFYVNFLGFACTANEPELGWARVQFDHAEFLISQPNGNIPFEKSIFTGSFYLNTDNVEEIWHKVKGVAEICYTLEEFDYGMKEFAIYDNNGYLLQFGQEIPE